LEVAASGHARLPWTTTNKFGGRIFFGRSCVVFSEDVGEIGWDRWLGWMGVTGPLAGSWDWPVAGTADPVVGRRAFSSRKGACLEGSCRRA
jgi:hypothetical protein